jgi:ABC-2 type transport system permease protein
MIFALLGFLFWLSVFGALAATIDDPNTSTRGPLMFMPAMFSAAGFFIVGNPDSMFARVTGLLPLTSMAVMPARVALTEVPFWELALSAALLAGGALLARRAAGKVFAVAMLMYGKEPSWGEVRRWVRETGAG